MPGFPRPAAGFRRGIENRPAHRLAGRRYELASSGAGAPHDPQGPIFAGVRCGLVNTTDKPLLDEAVSVGTNETMALSAVVKKRAENPTIALRCNSSSGGLVTPFFSRITALEVGTVTGP